MGEQKCQLSRRRFTVGLAVCSASAILPIEIPGTSLAQTVADVATTTGVAEIFLDLHRVHKWDNSNGDTWDPFWADDGNTYAFNCDGRGFGVGAMNLAFNKLEGTTPEMLSGSRVNAMDEYGKSGQKGADNAAWKACGQECIDGVFYAFVSRNTYGNDSGDPLTRQLAQNSSLIKSTDRGRTWFRSAEQNLNRPMWPGAPFGAPFFVHYGQNGGNVSRDGATDYVYASSTNGFWNDGDTLILGRVNRSILADLNSADWEYFTGGDGDLPRNWSRSIATATPILNRPAKCGQTPITYIPELEIYLLISWYNTARMTKWFEPNEMRYDFYQAPHPWGPWTPVSSFSDRFLGPTCHMYGPSLCTRFQQRIGADFEISLFTSGCPFDDVPSALYKMWHIPVVLRVASLSNSVLVAAADPQIRYHGFWFPWTVMEDAAEDRLARATLSKGAWAELSFSGTGIEYVAHKSVEQGAVVIYLDDVQQESTSLKLEDFPILLGVTVFSKQNLPKGKHVIKIVNAGESKINLQAFKVYS